jgi:septal ring factor EnvC (AmiA/AmiB activator)
MENAARPLRSLQGVARGTRLRLPLAASLLALLLPGLAPPSSGRQASPAPPSPRVGSTDQRLARVQERRRALERELARLRGQEKSLLGDVERLELAIRVKGEQLQETRLVLERTNAQLDATVSRAAELERSIETSRPLLAARARALYKLGELSYLRVLLSVERPSDMFRGYRFVTALARRDNQRFAAFRADLAALSAAQAELEAKTREVRALRSEQERTRRALDSDRARKTELLTRIVERKETQAAYLQELEDAEARLERLLQGFPEGELIVPVAVFKGTLAWPAAGRVRVPFGRRKHPRFETYTLQNGIEIEAARQAPVSAVYDGTVAFVERFRGYGLLVVLDHGGKHHSLYGHLDEAAVRLGQRVAAGETIGRVGSSGLDEPGLYFEMRFQGRPEDPLEWLKTP